MISKLLTSESKTVTGAAIIIGLATLASRCIGIIRDRVFAHYFGAGPIMDAYYASFKIPDLIYNLLIVGALTAGFIPTFTKLLNTDKTKEIAWKLANNIINIVGITLFVLSSLGIIFTTPLTHLLFQGFDSETSNLAINFTRIMFISPFLLGISMVFGGVLQSLRQFFIYSLAPVFYNLGIILGVLALTPMMGPMGLAWGVVLGTLLHVFVQTIGVYKNGYRWQWILDLKDPNTRLIGKLMLPRTLGLAIHQINTIVITILATLLSAGSVTIYNFADNLHAVPTGLIAIPFALAVFPVLSQIATQKNKDVFVEKVSETTRKILFLIIPVMVAILLLRAQIVRVILGSGAFDWNATIATANTLAFFAFGLIAQALIPLYARAFFALSNSKTPFLISIATEIVTIICCLFFMGRFGVAGLALGSSIGSILNITLLIIYLRRTLGGIDGYAIMTFIYKVSTAALAMGLAIYFMKIPLGSLFNLDYFWGILLQGLISGTVGLLIYGVLCYLLKVEEMTDFTQSFRKKWMGFWNIKEGIDEAEHLK